jgi:uncharacterized protein (DUF736 family)
MNIGSAWKKEKDGKNYLSCVIQVPFLGELNFAMFKNDKKEKDNQPDYMIVWSMKRKAESEKGNPFNDDVPF